jgi:hypothetical protein
MPSRRLFFLIFLVFPACGGKESTGSSDTTTTGGGSTVAGGTGGSSGTTGSGGGTGTAGQSGVGGQGQGGADWTSCAPKDICVLEVVGGCSPGCEPVPLSAFLAINSSNSSSVDAYRRATQGPCPAIVCPNSGPGEANIPNYYATCESGHCQPNDVRTSALSACTANSDCVLRNGTSCCGCGGGNLIAVSKQSNAEQTFCASGPCAADCVSSPLPPGVTAVCTTGHCAVRYATSDAGVQ